MNVRKGAWVDTDDLNDKKSRAGKRTRDVLHYTAEGYVTSGELLALGVIGLIEK